MDYMTIKEAAEKWGLSIRRIQDICKENKIPGVMKFGTAWAIPSDAVRPIKPWRISQDNRKEIEKLRL